MATRLNLGSGAYPLSGFDNLDLVDGWRFEDGLGQYQDGSIEGISISHALMHLPLPDWPAAFAEFARVLKPGGVIRVTEDSTADPASERFGGHPDAQVLTYPLLVIEHLAAVGIEAHQTFADKTMFKDDSLIQDRHGGTPKCFFVEGRLPPSP